ncbi:MAG: phosphatidate cytidylyltransferase [Oscillospiraceae bacterium]|nr:phosphatidate cytidylyltransferase [Oscillospiraceae bacterium]
MRDRLLVAAIGIPILLLVIIVLPKIALALLVAGMCFLAATELLGTTRLLRHPRLRLYSAMLAALVPIWCFLGQPKLPLSMALLIYFLLILGELLPAFESLRISQVSVGLLGALLVPYLLSAMVRLMMLEQGRFYVISLLVITFLADGGAYFAGCAFGKHKMAPNLSPHKTVEGLLGGFFAAVLAMLAYAAVCRYGFKLQVNYVAALVYGVVGAGASVLGDLGFSAIKRQTGIKDYGNLLPGHGGILDRFDSMVTTAPVIEVLVAFLPLFGGKIA